MISLKKNIEYLFVKNNRVTIRHFINSGTNNEGRIVTFEFYSSYQILRPTPKEDEFVQT